MQPAILPSRPDRAGRYLLVVAGLMSTAYAVQLLVDLGRPQIYDDEPAVGLLADVWPTLPKVQFWFTVAAWAVALATGAVTLVRRRRGAPPAAGQPWRMRLLVAAVLLLPFTTYPVATAFGHVATLLVCLPSTLVALWAVQRVQRYRRVPLALVLAVFGWGALIGVGFGAAMNTWLLEYGPAYLAGVGDPLHLLHKVQLASFVNASVSEELGKGAGVALAYLLFRHYFDGVVSGIVLGAAAGLGFNLVESVEYLAAFSDAGADFQYWVRQSIGILAVHTAFSAVVGAGFGVARQLAEPRLRRTAIACGFVVAAGGHFASDALLSWYTRVHGGWFVVGPAVDTLVLQPLALTVVQGPLVVLCLLLLRRGLRGQRAGLAAALRAEVATGLGAVKAAEVPVLLDPNLRLWLRITTLRRYGWAAHRATGRLAAAQLELGVLRSHRAGGEAADAVPDEDVLRAVVARRRSELAAAVPAGAVSRPARPRLPLPLPRRPSDPLPAEHPEGQRAPAGPTESTPEQPLLGSPPS